MIKIPPPAAIKTVTKPVLVVGEDHFNTLWLVRSLGMVGYAPFCIIVGRVTHRSFVAKSKYCKKCFYVDCIDDLPDFMLQLDFSMKVAVFPSGDSVAMVIDNNYDKLSEKYMLHNCENKQGQVIYWMDKKNMLSKARECGLTPPWSYVFKSGNNCDLTKISYPCILKPIVSALSTKNSFRICHNYKELREELLSFDDLPAIIQELISIDYEFLIFGVSTKEGVYIPGGLKKIETCSSINNLGMTSFAYYSAEIPEQVGDLDVVKNFVESIGYYGLFSIEFFITKEKAYFGEINLRNDGTCYITTSSGINMPALWAASCYNEECPDKGVMRTERTYGLNEINYLKYTLRKVGFIQSVKNFRKASAFSLYMKGDLKPFVYKILYHYV